MASQGPFFCGTGASDATVGAIAWANPTRITAEDASSADALLGGGQLSQYIVGSNYGFSIPVGATMVGVQVDAKMQSQGGGSPAAAAESTIKLGTAAGTFVGNNKSTSAFLPPAALTYVTYGGPTDMWGLTTATLTVALINSANFRCGISITNTNGLASVDPLIDAMRMTVFYTPAGPRPQQRQRATVGVNAPVVGGTF